MPEPARLNLRYTGRVQGVGFRNTARSIARRYPALTGWVQNNTDGSVSLEAQGPADALASFRQALRAEMTGFIHAETAQPLAPIAGEQGFEIRR